LLSISILSLAIILLISGNTFSDAWSREIPPGWELE
jgi:hypothetical protein